MKRVSPRYGKSSRYPVSVFERITDILAEMVLDDLQQHPQLHTNQAIDTCIARGNTSPALSLSVPELVK